MTYKLDSIHHELSQEAEKLGILVIDNAKVKRQEPGQLDVWWGIYNPDKGRGTWVWVEYKTDEGKLSPSQEQRIAECREASLPAEVVRSVDDVIRVWWAYRER